MTDMGSLSETAAMFTRKTKDGRTLRYEMNIIQQPQRARACGAGLKSAADRRPVDPPPVVELKIFDGPTDVTTGHNANLFLYTTLEATRQIATPKGGAIPPQTPVLTGTPVAGMVYLDRPSPAGYFIFPDLSVRHEGKYRLSFNLFEEIKVDGDMDLDDDSATKDRSISKLPPFIPGSPHQFVNFRLEVKSDPFAVFSAKKFPGLAESTDLSRCVAEQGCRVRIRRDVRVRVRKGGMQSSNEDLRRESSETRNDRFSTPSSIDQASVDRVRMPLNPINGGNNQPYPTIEAKANNNDQHYVKQSPYAQHAVIAPQPSSHYPAPHSILGGATHPFQPPQPNRAISSIHNSQTYSQHYHSRQNSSSSNLEYHRQQHQYSTPYHHPAQSSRSNTGYVVDVDTTFQAAQQPEVQQSSAIPSSTASNNPILPPLSSFQTPLAASPVTYEHPSLPVTQSSLMKTKRGYGTVFNGISSAGSVQNGSRPEISGQDLPQIETDDYGVVSEYDCAQMGNLLRYKRADGRQRALPVPQQTF